MKNDQLGNKVTLIPISDVLTISGNNYTLSSDKNVTPLYSLNDLDLDQKTSTQDAGVLYTQNMNLYALNLNKLQRFNNQSLLVVLETVSGYIVLWGSKEFPVVCQINPMITYMSLALSCSSIYPVVFPE